MSEARDTLPVVAGKINALEGKIQEVGKKDRQWKASRNVLIGEAHTRIVHEKELDVFWKQWVKDNLTITVRAADKIVKQLEHQPSVVELSSKSSTTNSRVEPKLYPRNTPATEEDPFVAPSTVVLPKPVDPVERVFKDATSLSSGQFVRLLNKLVAEAKLLDLWEQVTK